VTDQANRDELARLIFEGDWDEGYGEVAAAAREWMSDRAAGYRPTEQEVAEQVIETIGSRQVSANYTINSAGRLTCLSAPTARRFRGHER
jgi:hypothetical protein